jgi:hypothetical protein
MLRAAAMEEERRREAKVQAQAEQSARAGLEHEAAEAQRRVDQESVGRAEEQAARERRAREERERYRMEPPIGAPSPWYGGEGAYAAAMDYAAKVEPAFRGIRITRAHRHAGAAAAAAVIAILLALGWAAVSNRRPANPLGVNTLVQQPNVDQATPFGSTTIKPVASNPQVAASTQQVAARQSAAGHRSAVNGHQQKPAATHVRRAQKRSDDNVADDVVVRHFNTGRPVPNKAQQKQQAGLKKISDLQ